MEAVVWPVKAYSVSLSLFIFLSLLASVHFLESSGWLVASGFCCTTDNGLSLGILLDILSFSCVLRSCCFGSVGLSHVLQQFLDGVDVGVDLLIAVVLGLGGSWVGRRTKFPSLSTTWIISAALPQLAHRMQPTARSRASSSVLQPSDPGPPHAFRQGQLCSLAQTRGR